MQCQECGARPPGNPATCPECGAALVHDRDEDPVEPAPPPDDSSPASGEDSGRTTGEDRPDTDTPSAGERPTPPAADRPESSDVDRSTEGGQHAGERATDSRGATDPDESYPSAGAATRVESEEPDDMRQSFGGQEGSALGETLGALPYLPAVIGGVAVGVIFLLVGVVVSVFVPESVDLSTLDLAAITVVDLHFGFPSTLVPQFVYQRFEVFAPAPALLGLLYLLPPLFLYTIGKFVTAQSDARDEPHEAALSGASIVLGYLPIVLVATLLVPSLGGQGGGVLRPVLLGGIGFPVVFGALGGLADRQYTDNERRIGVAYGAGLFVVVALLLFLASFLSVSLAGDASLALVDRLLLTALIVAGTQTLVGVGTIVGPWLPVLLTILAAFGFGFLRVWRSEAGREPAEAALVPLTSAWTYLVLVAAVITPISVLADDYARGELAIGFLVNDSAETFVDAHLFSVGDYVVLLVLGTLLFPIVAGCAGGATAAWYEQRSAGGRSPVT